jgi:CheY-like chemotaxis protein
MVQDQESPVVLPSPKPSCVVCKGTISGINYECHYCGARLHIKCAFAVKEIQGGCFACGKPISELPALPQDVLGDQEASNADSGSVDPSAVAFNIVCAENDMKNESMLKHFFKSRFPSITLQTVHNGIEALSLVKNSVNTIRPVNLVLTAGAMPLMDGWKLCRVLKQRYSGIIVAIMDTSATLNPQDASFDEILPKPVDLAALYSFILRSWGGTG